MIRDTALTAIYAIALTLGACGYQGADEPNDSGPNRSEGGVEPAGRETTPDSPQAGETRDPQGPQGEYTGEMATESGTGEEDEPGGSTPNR